MTPGSPRGHLLLSTCLFLSGFSGLAYELLWTRWFGLTFGTMAVSVSAVLAAFFLGLAAGGWLGGRWAAKLTQPLRAYAWLEVGIAVFGVGSYALIRSLTRLEVALGEVEGGALLAVRFAIAVLVLFVPTCAMGATLPVLLRGVLRRAADGGRTTARVYGINTLGAVFGAYATSYWLLPYLGALRTLAFTVVLNLVVAAVVLVAFRRAPAVAAGEEIDTAAGSDVGRLLGVWLPLLLAALSGFISIALEVILTRLLSIVLEGTIYSFGAVLAIFLAGIGLGSLLIGPRLDRFRQHSAAGFAAYGLLMLTVFASLGLALLALPWAHFGSMALERRLVSGMAQQHVKLVIAALALLPAALAFGASFPLLVVLYRRAGGAARRLGGLYAVNTVGAILGSAGAGLVLVPWLGSDATLLLVMALLATTIAIAAMAAGRRGLALAAPLLFLGLTILWPGTRLPGLMRAHVETDWLTFMRQNEAAAAQTLYFAEGQTGAVAVYRVEEGGWSLFLNGLPQAGRRPSPPVYSPESVLLALLPYALHRAPSSALVVGYGAGVTTDILVHTATVQEVRVLDIEPRILEAVEAVYPPGEAPHQDPRVEVVVADARNRLLRDEARFDLVLNHVTDPWLSGAAGLATRELFALARRALEPEGIFMMWLGGWGEEHAASVAAALSEVFADLLVVTASGTTYLVASDTPFQIDWDRAAARLAEPGLQPFLAPLGLDRPAPLLRNIIGAGKAVPGPVPANTDDNAFVEVRLPLLRHATIAPLDALPGSVLAEPALTAARFTANGPQRVLALAEIELGTPGGSLPRRDEFFALAELERPHRTATLVGTNGEHLPVDLGRYLMGRWLLAQGRAEAAGPVLASIPGESIVWARAQRFLAVAAHLTGDVSTARAVSRALWQEGDAEGAYLYGLWAPEGDPSGARAALAHSLGKHPRAAVHLLRRALQEGTPEPTVYRTDLERAVAVDEDDDEALALLAHLATAAGDEVGARRYRARAVDAARRRAAALRQRAALHRQVGQPQRAEALVRAARRLDPSLEGVPDRSQARR